MPDGPSLYAGIGCNRLSSHSHSLLVWNLLQRDTSHTSMWFLFVILAILFKRCDVMFLCGLCEYSKIHFDLRRFHSIVKHSVILLEYLPLRKPIPYQHLPNLNGVQSQSWKLKYRKKLVKWYHKHLRNFHNLRQKNLDCASYWIDVKVCYSDLILVLLIYFFGLECEVVIFYFRNHLEFYHPQFLYVRFFFLTKTFAKYMICCNKQFPCFLSGADFENLCNLYMQFLFKLLYSISVLVSTCSQFNCN